MHLTTEGVMLPKVIWFQATETKRQINLKDVGGLTESEKLCFQTWKGM